MKTRLLFISIISILFIFSACNNNNDDIPDPVDRTVLVYIAGENTLDRYANLNIESMIQGAADGVLNGGNLLVYVDKKGELPQLIKISETKNGEIIKEVIETFEEHNSASVEVMQSIINKVISKYPAKSYGLDLWSHGTAWLPSDYKENYLRSFGEDTGFNSYLEIDELKEALPDGVFDFIIFDACYMASVEVVYALRNKADYILASPTEILGNGMPYQKIIKHWFSRTLSIENILSQTGSDFYTYYNDLQHGYTQWPKSASISLVKTNALENLAQATRNIILANKEDIYNINISNLQLLEYLYSSPHSLYDFKDFIDALGSTSQFNSALENAILYKITTDIAYYSYPNGTTLEIDKNHFCGLSVYVPQEVLPKLTEWYKSLDWYKAVYE